MKLFPLSRAAAAGLALAVVVTAPLPALAQEQSSEARIRKIERENDILKKATALLMSGSLDR